MAERSMILRSAISFSHATYYSLSVSIFSEMLGVTLFFVTLCMSLCVTDFILFLLHPYSIIML